MTRWIATAAACALVTGIAAGIGAAATVARHTRIQAERNVLHAHKVLRRLDPRLVDARTGLPHDDTTVICRGRGKRIGHEWPRFVCRVSYHRVRIAVLYDAQRHGGFELHRIHHR